MALTIKHSFTSAKSDGSDNTIVRPSNWNADHTITGNVDETMFSFTDITTGNASTVHHGLLKKLPNDSSLFIDGTGNWSAPSGGGGGAWQTSGAQVFLSTDGEYHVGINTSDPSFPLVVIGSDQGTYGFVGVSLESSASESGLQIKNTGEGGRTYSIFSTSAVSSLDEGYFVIADAGSATPIIKIDRRGSTNIPGRLQLGDFPPCDNALVTIYQTMDGTANSSMVDVIATGGGFSDMTALNVISHANGDMNSVKTIYVRADTDAGTVGGSAGIYIDSPQISGNVSTSYGLQVAYQGGGGQAAAFNIYSAGDLSVNFFEGAICIGSNANPEGSKLHVEFHGINPIGVLGEGYSTGNNDVAIGVKGVAGVGVSNTASKLISLMAGSPELDGGAQAAQAFGLMVEDVVGATANYAIKTGAGKVQIGDFLQCDGKVSFGNSSVQFTPSTPSSSSAGGVAGELVVDDSFIYVCTATNTWKRVAIATW